MVEIDSRKASLIAEIEVSRGEMRGALRQCEANLNPAELLRRSVRNNPATWISMAALLGLAVSQIIRLRPSRSPADGPRGQNVDWGTGGRAEGAGGRNKGSGWVASLWRLGFDLLKPALAEWATEQLAEFARAKLFTGHPQERNGVRPSARKSTAPGTSGPA